MKVIITGQQGYVANQLATYLSEKSLVQEIELISLREGVEAVSLEGVDVCIHCAALVHKKESYYQEADYFKVNADLTTQLAQKAKEQGVKQFIFLSTMAVYGIESGEIGFNTSLHPKTFYGKSKLSAEQALQQIETDDFIISIVRPPMIYGFECPGNYTLLQKVAKLTPIFPFIHNERSMLFIDHLSEFLFQLMYFQDRGVFHPQDASYMNTSFLVKEIANKHQHPILLSKMIGRIVMNLFSRKPIIQKVFGDLTYSKELSMYRDNTYQMYSFEKAVARTEGRGY